MQALVEQKIAGKDVAEAATASAPRAQVIDLMEALKESLVRGRGVKAGTRGPQPAAAGATEAVAGSRRPNVAAGAAAENAVPPKRARKK